MLGPGHTGDGHIKHGKAHDLWVIKTGASIPQPQLMVELTRFDVVSHVQVGEHSTVSFKVCAGRRAVRNIFARDLNRKPVNLTFAETILIRDYVLVGQDDRRHD